MPLLGYWDILHNISVGVTYPTIIFHSFSLHLLFVEHSLLCCATIFETYSMLVIAPVCRRIFHSPILRSKSTGLRAVTAGFAQTLAMAEYKNRV